jgi:hypothetical protein
MIQTGPAPLRNPLVAALFPSEPWSKWFRDVAALLCFENNHSRDVTPGYSGLTEVGTIAKGLVYVKDRNLITVFLSFTPAGAGTIAMTAGSSYLSNLPYAASLDAVGVLVNLSTLAVVGGVHAAAGTARVNLPTLAASNARHAATLTYRTDDA